LRRFAARVGALDRHQARQRQAETEAARGRAVAGQVCLRHLARELPVDRTPTGRGEHVLQLAHELLQLLRIVRIRYTVAAETEAERGISRHRSTVRRYAGHGVAAVAGTRGRSGVQLTAQGDNCQTRPLGSPPWNVVVPRCSSVRCCCSP
jgi:hypothetical protein